MGQADGHNSEINIVPRAIFDDPFRGYPHVLVITDAYNAWDDTPAIGNTRAACAEIHDKYKKHDAWYGIEQEYQIGPCRGIEIGDHMAMARYIMLRVTESHNCVVSWDPK